MKRMFDVIISVIALILLSPLLLILYFGIRIKLGRPVLFTQPRVGKNGKVFMLRKFRSMTDERDELGKLLGDEHRLTSFGRQLRASSLDELPTLFNVLVGDMSVVGPRPLLVDYLPLYSAEQARRHEVLPGITGWAQINGRNSVSWEQKFNLDTWYVDHRTMILDVKILVLTVLKVLRQEGITGKGSATMSKFTGSDSSK